jgi:predicted Zn-dependent peptidase
MNMKKLLLTLCLAAVASLPAVAQQQQQPARQTPPQGGTPKPFVLPKTERLTLKNGMRVTLVPYGSVPKVTVTAVVRAGNLNEQPNQVWLADLMGRMLKEGTSSRTGEQIAREAAEMGGQVNVLVAMDTTSVSGDVLSQHGSRLVALLADVLRNPQFPASELKRHQTDMLRQVSIAKSQPGPIANELFRRILYPNHPYGRLYPTPEMISGYRIEDVRKFYADNFGAGRTHLYVAGRFDAAEMRRAITSAFEPWAAGTPVYTNIPKPKAVGEIHLVDRPNTPQATLYVGLPVVDPSHPDYIPFVVTNSLLGGSFGSRITSNIREAKGYTYSPISQLSSRYRDAYWVEIADVTTDVTGPALKEIVYEIDRLRKEAPPEAELQGIKNYLAGIFVLQNSSRAGVIAQLASADLHGHPPDYLSTYVQRIMAVTPRDVQRIAQQYLAPDKMAVVVVGDRAKVEPQLAPFGKVITN